MQVHQLADVGGEERRAAGDALVEHDAERVQVGPAVDRAVQQPALFRRGVGERAGDRPRRADAQARRVAAGRGGAEVDEAEVDEHRAPVGAHHDVVRLDVPVDQPDPVRGGERVGDRGAQHRGGRLVELPSVQHLGQRAALDQLHHQVGAAVDLADGVHPDDARVVDAGQHGGFAAELVPRLVADARGEAEDLDRVLLDRFDVRPVASRAVDDGVVAPTDFAEKDKAGYTRCAFGRPRARGPITDHVGHAHEPTHRPHSSPCRCRRIPIPQRCGISSGELREYTAQRVDDGVTA